MRRLLPFRAVRFAMARYSGHVHAIHTISSSYPSGAVSCFRPRQGVNKWFSSAPGKFTISVPSMGDSITEGEVVELMKGVGDTVETDEVVAILETDKVSVDIRSPQAGVVSEVSAEPGQVVKVGAQIFTLDSGGQATATSSSSAMPSSTTPPSSSTPSPSVVSSDKASSSPLQPVSSISSPPQDDFATTNHAYQPMIQFRYGNDRREPSSMAPTGDLIYIPVPAQYARKYMSQLEIEAVESGGATLFMK
uniref:Lipoyl-binding domain-containing protein n=1 Tax=Spongospora subterranea TaxID=70186 RepID=A0A0H5RLE7_9EUKA|eukprot:CRZ09549.1 hypothetical protein [Spongospora subterranea]